MTQQIQTLVPSVTQPIPHGFLYRCCAAVQLLLGGPGVAAPESMPGLSSDVRAAMRQAINALVRRRRRVMSVVMVAVFALLIVAYASGFPAPATSPRWLLVGVVLAASIVGVSFFTEWYLHGDPVVTAKQWVAARTYVLGQLPAAELVAEPLRTTFGLAWLDEHAVDPDVFAALAVEDRDERSVVEVAAATRLLAV